MNLLKKEWLQILILIVPFCAVALLWDKLPEKMPIHWNARGQVDGYGGKFWGAMGLPLTTLGMAAFMSLLPMIDPKLRQQTDEAITSVGRTIRILRLATTGFFSLMSLAVLAASLGLFKNGVQFSYVIYAGVSLLFIVLGNFMAKLRPNYYVGIRTPWTLSSNEVWAKTHRLGGPLMVGGGFAMLLLLLVVPLEKYAYLVLLPIVISLTAITSIYSYRLHRKETQNHSTS